MPRYVIFMDLTDKGRADIKGSPARVQAGIKAIEDTGGKVLSFSATLGPHDFVAVTEGPSDEYAATMGLALVGQGYVTLQTCRAFSPEEFAGIVGQVP